MNNAAISTEELWTKNRTEVIAGIRQKSALSGCASRYDLKVKIKTMREIKFRAWEKEDKELGMHYIDFKETDESVIEFDYTAFTRDDLILMQYTNLKDKNGKEIYEGDIVHTKWAETFVGQDDSKNIVYWSNENGAWCHNKEGKDVRLGNFYLRFHCHPKHIKVIGNIYENPELLN